MRAYLSDIKWRLLDLIPDRGPIFFFATNPDWLWAHRESHPVSAEVNRTKPNANHLPLSSVDIKSIQDITLNFTVVRINN